MPEMNDTSPEADSVQIQLLQKATPAQRVARARSLSGSVIRLSRQAIKRNNPAFSDSEVKLAFITLHYGKGLSEKVAEYLKGDQS